MKTPSPRTLVLVVALLFLGGAVFTTLAVIVPPTGATGPWLRMWLPKYLLGLAAAACVFFATAILAVRRGRQRDAVVAVAAGGLVSMPVYVYPVTLDQLRRLVPHAPRLPSSVVLVATATRLEVWGRPHVKLLSLSWSEVSGIRAVEVRGPRGARHGLSVDLGGPDRGIEFVASGQGLLGHPTRELAVDAAARFDAVRGHHRSRA